MTTKEKAIKFANWLREVDTQERACEWFGYTDEDMYDYFCFNVLRENALNSGKNGLDLVKLDSQINELLAKETKETLTNWLDSKRNNTFEM